MANSVKFIQIKGTPNDYIGNGVGTEYHTKLEAAKLAYPGAIIFGQYVKTSGGKVYYELWANNQQYKFAGGGGDIAATEGTDYPWDHTFEDLEKGHIYIKINDLNTTKYKDQADYEDGDLTGIVTEWKITAELEDPETRNSENAAQNRTAYIFTGETLANNTQNNWKALFGNISAENVYFPRGVLRTIAFGVLPATGGNLVTDGVNKNLQDLLEYYLVQEVTPSPTITSGTQSVQSWTVQDEGASLSVSVNGTANQGGQIPVGSKINATGTYNQNLKSKVGNTWITSGFTDTATFTPNKITGMSFGYYYLSNNKFLYTKDTNKIGTIPNSGTIYYWDGTSDTGESIGDCSAQIKINFDLNEVSGTKATNYIEADGLKTYSDSILNPSYNDNYQVTDIGTLDVTLKLENNSSWKRKVSNPWPSEIAAVGPVYVSSNKKAKSSTATTANAVSLTAPTPLVQSCTRSSDPKVTFTVYYPVYGNIKSDTLNAEDAEIGRITENICFIETEPTGLEFANSAGPMIVKVPTGFSITKLDVYDNGWKSAYENKDLVNAAFVMRANENIDIVGNKKNPYNVTYKVYDSNRISFAGKSGSTNGARYKFTITKD